MARDEINYEKLDAAVRKMVAERAQIALEIYTLEALEYDAAGYPFARHQGQRSIRSPRSQSIVQTATGVSIIVEAEGAEFIEFGNAPPGGGLIRARKGKRLAIPLKGGTVVAGQTGALLVSAVRPYEGTDRLRRAVMKAFGIGV